MVATLESEESGLESCPRHFVGVWLPGRGLAFPR